MIRLLLTTVLLFTLGDAWGGCSDTISSRGTKPENAIEISDGGCGHSELMINESYRFSEQCSPYRDGFACKRDGYTSLAGATYVPVYDAKPACGGKKPDMRYKCVKGCGKRVPKYLYVEPYEC